MHSKIQDMAARGWVIGLCSFILICHSQAESEWAVTYGGTVQAFPGHTVILPCTFKYPDKGTAVTWAAWMQTEHAPFDKLVYSTKSGEELDQYRGRTSLVGDLNKKDCSLKIINVQKNDNHKYFFRFHTHDNATGPEGIQLKVFAEDEWAILYGQNVEAYPGQTVILSCTFMSGDKGNAVSWAAWIQDPDAPYDNLVYSTISGEEMDQYRGRTSLVGDLNKKNCSLKIVNVRKQDEGQYFFRFTSVSHWTGRDGIQLTVTDAYSPRNTRIMFQPDRVKIGMNVIMKCTTDSWPKAHTYTWTKQMPSGDIKTLKTSGDSTEIQQVQVEDSGDYLCQPINIKGSERVKGTLRVYSVPDSVHVQQDGPVLVIGQPASLSCSVTNVYPSNSITITWYQDVIAAVVKNIETALPDGTFNITSSLNFTPLTDHDGKTCACSVQGDDLPKTINTKVLLKVIAVPDSVHAQQDVPVLVTGEPASLSCSVTNVYPSDSINITWCQDVIAGVVTTIETALPDGTFNITSSLSFTASTDHNGKTCVCLVHSENLQSLLQGVFVLEFQNYLQYIIYGAASFIAIMCFCLGLYCFNKRRARTFAENAEDNTYWDVVFQSAKI